MECDNMPPSLNRQLQKVSMPISLSEAGNAFQFLGKGLRLAGVYRKEQN